MTPATNLEIQTRIIGNAKAFVGTYGGFSYLAPFCGTSTVAFYSNPNAFRFDHLEVSKRVFSSLKSGSFVPLEVKDLGVVRLALGRSISCCTTTCGYPRRRWRFDRVTLPTLQAGRCFVIGEVGLAHDGSLGYAHAFIDEVARAGADAVKFQTHIAEAESTPVRAVPRRVQQAGRVPIRLLEADGIHREPVARSWPVTPATAGSCSSARHSPSRRWSC